MNRRVLYRSVDDRILGGVAGGMADYFDLDPSIVRVLWIVAVPFTAGLAFLAYIVMMIVVPEQTDVAPPNNPWQPGGEPVRPNTYNPGAYAASYAPPPSTSGGDPAASDASGDAPEADSTAGATEAASGMGGTQADDAVDSTQSWTASDARGGRPGSGFAPGMTAPSPYPPGSREDRRWQRRQRREYRWQERQERWRSHFDEWEGSGERWERRHSSSGPIVWGILLIMVGLVLLLERFDPSFNVARTWPYLTIGFGALLVVLSFLRGIGSR